MSILLNGDIMSRRFFVFIICLFLIFSLFACANGDSSIIDSCSKESNLENSFKTDNTTNTSDLMIDENLNNSDSALSLSDEYRDTINEFKQLMELRLSDAVEEAILNGSFDSPNPTFDYEWGYMIAESILGTDTPDMSMFGYVLKDINNDGISELFIVRNDPESYSFILALYTLHEGEAVLLGAYWPKHNCYLLESGELFVEFSGGGDVYYHEIQTLEENRTELTTVNKFGLNPYDTKKPYFETVDGEITLSNEERVNELFNNYSNSIYSEFWEEIYPLR